MQNLIDQLNFNILIIRREYTAEGVLAAPRIVKANVTAAAFLGYSQQALMDQLLAPVFATGKEMTLFTEAASKLPKHAADSYFEGELITHSKHKIPCLFTLSALPSTPSALDVMLLMQPIKPDQDRLLMHRVVEQSATAVMITDYTGNIEYVNPKFCELSGYSQEELLGQNPKQLQSGTMPAEHYHAMWESLLINGKWRGEIQNLKKNGETYWVFESLSAIKNSDGDVTHYLAVEEDITRRKAVEAALTESEERFRQMAEMTGEWLWEQDPEGYYSYSSNAVQQILGFSPDKVIGKHYTEYLSQQDKATQPNLASSQKPFYALINHYQHKEGRPVFTESTGLPILNAEGKLIKWRGVDRDITARMHFQNALIESDKRTRLIIDSSINAIVIMDSYGMITDWNHRAEFMFGWSAEDVIGQRLDELIVPPRFRQLHRQGLATFLKTGMGRIFDTQLEFTALRRNGEEFPIELSVSPLKLGNSYIFSGFIHDISGRKAAEEEIRQAQVNLAISQNELQIAQQIQASLSPSLPLVSDQFEVTGACIPANKVGGDYYDYFMRHPSQLDIVIADVSGHSIGPALFMVETRSAIRAQTNLSASPAETLGVVNSFLFDDLDHSDYFITLFYLQVDLEQQRIRFANAGHPPPLHFNSKHHTFKTLDTEGLILGIKREIAFEEQSWPLNQGDIILFYTDGIIEAENQQQAFFGVERVKALLLQHAQQPAHIIIDVLFDALKEFCQKSTFEDDVTLMLFKWL